MKNYRKPYRLKKKKPIWRNRFFWSGALVLFIIGSFAHILFFSWIFQVRSVTITGENKISQKDVRLFFPQKNIFLINIKETKNNILSAFPEIADVKIRRSFPAALNVIITERRAVVIWCNEDGNCFLTDQEGVLFKEMDSRVVLEEENNNEKDDLVRVFGEKEFLDKKLISYILAISLRLKKDLGVEIEKAVPISLKRLNIETSEGWKIYFNLEADIDWQLTQLRLLFERQISSEERDGLEYIDLRFKYIYYK